MKKVFCLALLMLSLTGCSLSNKNIPVKENMETEVEPETVDYLNFDWEEEERKIDELLDSSDESKIKSATMSLNLSSAIVYFGDVKMDLNKWKEKDIYEILDDISSAGLYFTKVTGTISHDKNYLKDGIPLDEVKLALNNIDPKHNLLEIEFAVKPESIDYKLTLYKFGESYILSFEANNLSDSFYISDSKFTIEDLGVMNNDADFDSILKSSNIFDDAETIADISYLNSSDDTCTVSLNSNGIYSYSVHEYNPHLENKELDEKVDNQLSKLNDVFSTMSQIYNEDISINLYQLLGSDVDDICEGLVQLGFDKFDVEMRNSTYKGEYKDLENIESNGLSAKDALSLYNKIESEINDYKDFSCSLVFVGYTNDRPMIKYSVYIENDKIYNKTISLVRDYSTIDNLRYTNDKYDFYQMSEDDMNKLLEPLVQSEEYKYTLSDGNYEFSLSTDILNNVLSMSVKQIIQ